MVRALVRDAFFPRHARVAARDAGAGVPGLERWYRDIGDGRVEAWFLPALGAPQSTPTTLVFFHGNAELIDDWADALEPLRRRGYHVLLPEYRGYGRSKGEPSEASIVDDARHFVDRLAGCEGVGSRSVVYIGRSLGGGVASALALLRPPRAMVLMSTFTSARAMARRYFIPGFLVADPFDNLDAVARLHVPIWVVHGSFDDLVPVSHAHALVAAAHSAKLTLCDAGHNDCPPSWPAFLADLGAWLEEVAR